MKRGPFDFTQGILEDEGQPRPDFDEFEAIELYCPKCGQAVPVRKSLLLVLPDGDKYEYRCEYCGETVGEKIDRSGQFYGVLKR